MNPETKRERFIRSKSAEILCAIIAGDPDFSEINPDAKNEVLTGIVLEALYIAEILWGELQLLSGIEDFDGIRKVYLEERMAYYERKVQKAVTAKLKERLNG